MNNLFSRRSRSLKRRTLGSSVNRVRNRLRAELLEDRRLLAANIQIGDFSSGSVNRDVVFDTVTYTANDSFVEIAATDIANDLLSGLNVVVDTTNGFLGGGDIVLSSPIEATSTFSSLTFRAENDIVVAHAIDMSLGFGSLVLNSDSDGSGEGRVDVTPQGSITLTQGDITIGGGFDPLVDPAFGIPSNPAGVTIRGPLLTEFGEISIRGRGSDAGVADADGVRIESSVTNFIDGIINIHGTAGAGGDFTSNGVQIDGSVFSDGPVEITITGAADPNSTGILQGVASEIGGTFSSGLIRLTADRMDLQNVSGMGDLEILPIDPATNIGFHDGAPSNFDQLNVFSSAIGANFRSVEIGDANGTGTLTLENATFDSDTVIVGSNIHVGSLSAGQNVVTLVSSGVISNVHGNQNIAAALTFLSGNVSPGQSPGILDIDGSVELDFDSTLSIEINGNEPGGETFNHDQIRTTGDVTIGGNVTLSLSSTQQLDPLAGHEYILINNGGANPINGQFVGLAEGAELTDFLGTGFDASVTYVGGDGNDFAIVVGGGETGGDLPIPNEQPFATTNYAIALVGIFPSSGDSQTAPSSQFLGSGSDPFIGEIIQFAGNFAPRGFALAEGQLLQISQNSALFSLLGTAFGGDGQTTFALPDLRGRVPIGVGTGDGLSPVSWGQRLGSETVTLSESQLPSHTHDFAAGSTTTLSSVVGGGQSHDNMMPSLGLHNMIDTNGEVRWVGFNFAPTGFAFPEGQTVDIVGNELLFSELGTTYGGDGTTTFNLPDLRGRALIDDGDGTGLTSRALGDEFGQQTVTLSTANLPDHTHPIPGDGEQTGSTGDSLPYTNTQPSLVANYQIATIGVFPSRNLASDQASGGDGSFLALNSQGDLLTESDADAILQSMVDQGIERWRSAGFDETQLAELTSVNYAYGSLEPGVLASINGPNTVTVDWDAAGQGWFADSTLAEDEEFGVYDSQRGWVGTTNEALAGVDLLTVIMHEQGHLLGLEHDLTGVGVMAESLVAGVRRLPTGDEIADDHELEFPAHVVFQGDTFIAQIHTFASTDQDIQGFVPTDGRLLDIASNAAFFSLIGTIYGGDGRVNFAVPDFRGRVVSGTTGSSAGIGDTGGTESTTLTVAQLPSHTHETLVRIQGLQPVNPLGSLIYEQSTVGSVDTVGGTDHFVIGIDPDQTLTVTLSGMTDLQGEVRVRDASGQLLGTASAGAAGEDIVVQNVPTGVGGDFDIFVEGLADTTGDYTVQVTLNAGVESENLDGQANDTTADAQDISGSFVEIAGGLARRGGVVGTAQAGTDDVYRFDLLSGERVSLATSENVTVSLLDSSGILLAKSIQSGLGSRIQHFLAADSGSFFAVVSSEVDDQDYGLVVASGATVGDGTEINVSEIGGQLYGLQNFEQFSIEFNATAGDNLTLRTFGPGSGIQEPANVSAGTVLRLTDPNGVLAGDVGTNEPDGRNVRLSHTATETGIYRVEVFGIFDTGQSFLSVSGNTGSHPAPTVSSSQPSDGGASISLDVTLDFSESLLSSSVDASDVTIGGLPAVAVNQIDGDTFEFTADPAANVGEGQYAVSIAADSMTDLQGTGISAVASSFQLDTTAPRITELLFNSAALPTEPFEPGQMTIQLTFDEPVSSFSASALTLVNQASGQTIAAQSTSFNTDADQLTVDFGELPEGRFELTLRSGDGAFEDTVGNDLDGEPIGASLSGLPSGDGAAGGDFTSVFAVDQSASQGLEFDRLLPLGSLIARSVVTERALDSATDQDAFEFELASGQTVAAILTPTDDAATLSLTMGSTTVTGSPGAAVTLSPQFVDASGTQSLVISGDDATAYTLEIVLNAAVEDAVAGGDSEDGNELSIDDSFIELGSGRYAVIGTVSGSLINGGFETGDFTGWTATTTTGNPFQPWSVVGAGPSFGFVFAETEPQEGSFVASNGFDASSGDLPFEFTMHQDVLVRENATLTWDFRAQWDFTFGADATETRVAVVELLNPETGDLIATLDTFETGTQDTNPTGDTGWQTQTADLSAFAGQTVRLNFRQVVPELSRGPGQIEFDAIGIFDPLSTDEFTLDLTGKAGELIDVILAGQANADMSRGTLELLDVDGSTVLATGSVNPLGIDAANFDLGILDFAVPADGVYTVRVSNSVDGEYALLVTESLSFDSEPNDDATVDALRDLTVTQSALGFAVEERVFLAADFSDDGSPSLDGFTIDAGSTNQWHLSQGRDADTGHSGPDSLYFGSGETTTGGGAYDNDSTGSVTSPIIDLSDAENTELSFSYFLDTESVFDRASVSVSTDEGATFDTLVAELNSTNGEFVDQTIDLNQFTGEAIQIRFNFSSDSVVNNEGWYLDDIRVGTPTAIVDGEDNYSIDLISGDPVVVRVEPLFAVPSATPLNTLMPEFNLIHPDGTTIVATSQGAIGDVVLDAPEDGTYTIQVTANSGAGEYLVIARDAVFEAIISETEGDTTASEDGDTDAYDISLSIAPAADVEITVSPDAQLNLGAGAGVPITLTFTPSDARTPQTVNVIAVDDLDIEAALHSGLIGHSISTTDTNFDGVAIANLSVDVTENDSLTPVIASSDISPTGSAVIPITVSFGAAVTEFDADDIQVAGGTVQDLMDDGNGDFSFGVAPANDGDVTIDIVAGAALDAGGKDTLAATQFSIASDRTAPVPVITGPTSTIDLSQFDITITFGEVISGFELDDLTVSGGSASNLVVDGNNQFTATISGDGQGVLAVDIAADVVTDAAGNGNSAATQFTVLDFGDAPDDYPVTLDDDGARHSAGSLFLGTSIDGESNGQPSEMADGDGADEDGVGILATPIAVSGTVTTAGLVVQASEPGLLDAWVDFNGDGDWDDTGEQIATNASLVAGLNAVTLSIPADAVPGDAVARFRISTAGGLQPTGAAVDGEVEDHIISIADGSTIPSVDIQLIGDEAEVSVESDELIVQVGGTEILRVPVANLDGLNVEATGEDDVITVDFAGGIPALPGGLQVNGATGSDELNLLGSGEPIDLTDDDFDLSGFPVIDLGEEEPTEIIVDAAVVAQLSPTTRRVLVQGGDGDKVKIEQPEDWRFTESRTEGDVFIIAASTAESGGDETLEFALPNSWHNFLQSGDVNNNGDVTATDALRIINELRRARFMDPVSRILRDPASIDVWPHVYLDVNDDDRGSALDALVVINQLLRANQASNGGTGEAEPINSAIRQSSVIDEVTDASVSPATLDAIETIAKAASFANIASATPKPIDNLIADDPASIEETTDKSLADEALLNVLSAGI